MAKDQDQDAPHARQVPLHFQLEGFEPRMAGSIPALINLNHINLFIINFNTNSMNSLID